jgi:hypothetical protein
VAFLTVTVWLGPIAVSQMCSNSTLIDGFQAQATREKAAMIKRLKMTLNMVGKHEAFHQYDKNCQLAADLGAFHDCPVGASPGSMESKSASYTSNMVHRELLECLADAVREYWLDLRREPPRWSACCDETSDVSGKSQNAIAVKIVLPNGATAVPFAGLHEMPRGTSLHLLNTLVYQLKDRDGFSDEELQKAFNDFSADTCNAMFGRLSGLATRLAEMFANLNARKCGNHKGALAASHGCNAVPYVKNHFLPCLEMMGVQMDASNKKGTFVADANLEFGTDTAKIGRSSATRWNSRWNNVKKILSPANFVTTYCVFFRAGEGGIDDMYYESAGRADATSAGCARKFCTREFWAFTQALTDLLGPLVTAGQKLQAWDLDHGTYKLAITAAIDQLKGCRSDPAKFCPNLHGWEKNADEVDQFLADRLGEGTKLRRTRGRSDAWINSQIKMLVDALIVEHEEYFAADELNTALDGLLDVHRVGAALPAVVDDTTLQDYYADLIGPVLDRYADVAVAEAILTRDTFAAEWQSFARDYRSRAAEFEEAWCTAENGRRTATRDVETTRIRRKRAKEVADGVAIADLTPLPPVLVPVTKVPLGLIVGDAYGREAQRGPQDPGRKPQVVMVLATWLTLMFSQAPIESVFSQMKLAKRVLRHRMAQSHLEMSMMIKINGPGSWNGKQAGFSEDSLLEAAFKKFLERVTRRLMSERVESMASETESEKANRAAASAELDIALGVPRLRQHPKYAWGRGFEHTPDFRKQEKNAAELATLNHRKRMASANDGVRLGVGSAPESFMIKSIEAGNAVVDRECVVDLGGMKVSIGDAVACTGWGGTTWYTGRVGAEKRKGAKQLWVVYFEREEEYAIMELAAGRHGKATAAATAPGQAEKWKGGWMFLVPTTEQDGLVPRPRAQAALGVDDAEMAA